MRTAAPWLALIVLAGWIFHRFGQLGFNPTDDGFILGQAYRLLHGAVPHRDIISPRPLGSAYLHMVDFLVPLPLLEATRLVAAIEITATSMFCGWLVLDRPPHRWGVATTLAVAASALVNLHVFPLMAWHTVDGILLVSAGAVAISRAATSGRRRVLFLGMVMVGASATVKQSFAPAMVMAAVAAWFVIRRQHGRRRAFVTAIAALVSPAALYGSVVTLSGGGPDMVTQLTRAHRASLLAGTPTLVWSDRAALLPAVALVVAGLAILWSLR
ncbi:MAG: hypothetical protein QOG64_643, partial [Acidimicrobiaceae bacterium]|nr:hypothetical protein [Acidimicrobiaceae bacterium]